MEIQFLEEELSCIRQVKDQLQTVEQTQELRMPDEYPDIGRILGAWGQVLLRGKEWQDENMSVSGGVMVWILYQPEDETAPIQTVEAWLPFQAKWQLPQLPYDGKILTNPLLRSVDARITSARKLMARVSVSILAQAYVADTVQFYQPPELPEDIHVLKQTHCLKLTKEAGEKTFEMEEEFTLPMSCPKPERVIRYSLQPELIDQKVLSGKLVFRGISLLHLLYEDEGGQLCTWDQEVPFSQYCELDGIYEQDAEAMVLPVVTALELEIEPEGLLRLKMGMTGQYLIYDSAVITVAKDAYSVERELQLWEETVQIPSILECGSCTVAIEQKVAQSQTEILNVAFYPEHPTVKKEEQGILLQLGGQFHLLCCEEGRLGGEHVRFRQNCEQPAWDEGNVSVWTMPSGNAKVDTQNGGSLVCGDVLLRTQISNGRGITMLRAVEAGETREPDADRPTIIIRKSRGACLWELAKSCGSTVEAIKSANKLDREPEADTLLLIPVL